MYKVLIVDDEPLVQAGISSMFMNLNSDFELVATASNGQIAMEKIRQFKPSIVITDIKMPVMNGFELIDNAKKEFRNNAPKFIVLTSYEEFSLVKQALTLKVVDYLVKLELTPDGLLDALNKARAEIISEGGPNTANSSFISNYSEKFFIKLLNGLFESEEQFILQAKDLALNFDYSEYICCYGEMKLFTGSANDSIEAINVFNTAMLLLKELVHKFGNCYCIALDTRHFGLILCKNGKIDKARLTEEISNVRTSLSGYYSVTFYAGIGLEVEHPFQISSSFQSARHAFSLCSKEEPIFCLNDNNLKAHSPSISLALFKDDLIKAFEEYNRDSVRNIIDNLCDLFSQHRNHLLQAKDAACNILFLAISMLPDGEHTIEDIFSNSSDPLVATGYKSIYNLNSVSAVITWLQIFKTGILDLFENHRKEYRNKIVDNVKKYIQEHVTEKLTLNDTAAVFGISPNYLSQIFGKYSEVGFSEYINQCKITEAKKLLIEENLKVYEVAEKLGFESAFYFSKVFKKATGIAPTDFVNR